MHAVERTHLELKVCKADYDWTTFGSCDVKKLHAVGRWRETRLEVKLNKAPRVGPLFHDSMAIRCLWRKRYLKVKSKKSSSSRSSSSSSSSSSGTSSSCSSQ